MSSQIILEKTIIKLGSLLALGFGEVAAGDPAIGDGLNIRAQFEDSERSDIVTSDAYRIQIDRVAVPDGELNVRPRDRDDLDRILAQLERPTIDITPGYEMEPQETSLVLTNAQFEGRVFDETGLRKRLEQL